MEIEMKTQRYAKQIKRETERGREKMATNSFDLCWRKKHFYSFTGDRHSAKSSELGSRAIKSRSVIQVSHLCEFQRKACRAANLVRYFYSGQFKFEPARFG